MPSFTGRFRYLDTGGAKTREGECRLSIEKESLRLVPSSGPPLAFDLGDIDSFLPGDYELTLRLYTGNTIVLTHFAKAFQNLAHDLLEAYRSRLVQCLMVMDLEEVERFDGWAQLDSKESGFSGRSEVRLYRSNFAILPEAATGFSWRYADIDSVDFDEATYTLGVRSGADRLILTRFAKRSRELAQRLQDGVTAISDVGARVLHSTFPFLTPDQFQEAALIYREGRAVPISGLNRINPRMESALLDRAVDASLKKYLDILKGLSVDNEYFCGFELIRKESSIDEEGTEEAGTEEAPEAGGAAPDESADLAGAAGGEEEGEPILHWFFFPMKSAGDPSVVGNVVAWEATSRSGRATYFFRLVPPGQAGVLEKKPESREAVAAAVRGLNRAIVTLNFRREPIYLPDESLQTKERFRRYAIACRKIPVLRQLRASFLGRALHTSPEAWEKQVHTILAGK